MKRFGTKAIIHIFALLHAVASLLLRDSVVGSEMVLTSLTLWMALTVCLHIKLSLQSTIWLSAFATLLGYIIGNGVGMYVFRLFTPQTEFIAAALISFATTEVIGFALLYAGKALYNKDSEPITSTSQLITIAIAALLVLLVRILITFIYQIGYLNPQDFSDKALYFLTTFCVVTVMILILLTTYAVSERKKANREKLSRQKAQYKYQKLNQQLKPHFLFNSLNILNCLISDGLNREAGNYIERMSDLYRYMLDTEDRSTVKLWEEMDFVENYIELMHVRFPDGFTYEKDLSGETLNRDIVPGSVQMLVENAIKHNCVSIEKPLRIRIYADGTHLTVYNTLQRKQAPVPSTGKGLKYIRQEYADITRTAVEIHETEESFIVKLPLISEP